MKRSRAFMVSGVSASMIAAGFVAAPKELTAVEFGEAGGDGGNTFDGPAVSNLRGTYQLQITVEDDAVTEVTFLTAGTSAPQSVAVNAFALPLLRERILAAQTWDVEHVSGSSYSSPAMIESAEGAFRAAGLD